VRSYLFIGNKKCRIYAACGVSQTPKIDKNVVGNEEESRKQHGTRGKIYG